MKPNRNPEKKKATPAAKATAAKASESTQPNTAVDSGGSDLGSDLDLLVDAYVHVLRLKRFFDLRTLRDYDNAQLDILHRTDSAADQFFRGGGRVVEGVTYRPGAGRFVDEQGVECLNLYRPSNLLPTFFEDVQPWLDLLAHIVPDEPAREHMLDFLAHLVQYPGEKINHAILLGGAAGIGKDSLLLPIIDAVGQHNVSLVTPQELDGGFNDWLAAHRRFVRRPKERPDP